MDNGFHFNVWRSLFYQIMFGVYVLPLFFHSCWNYMWYCRDSFCWGLGDERSSCWLWSYRMKPDVASSSAFSCFKRCFYTKILCCGCFWHVSCIPFIVVHVFWVTEFVFVLSEGVWSHELYSSSLLLLPRWTTSLTIYSCCDSWIFVSAFATRFLFFAIVCFLESRFYQRFYWIGSWASFSGPSMDSDWSLFSLSSIIMWFLRYDEIHRSILSRWFTDDDNLDRRFSWMNFISQQNRPTWTKFV